MLTQAYEQALAFAFQLHREQTRKGSGAPYFSHLMAVSGLVLEYGGSEAQAIAALLHDAVEDQSQRLGGMAAAGGAIAARFGEDVAAMVLACTDAETLPKPPWRVRKERYIAHVAQMTPQAALVSCCDKLHNARSLVADFRLVGDALFRRFSASRADTLWYYAELAASFRRHHPGRAAHELERTVRQLEALVREADAARASADAQAPRFDFDRVALGRPGDGTIDWLFVDQAGNLVAEREHRGGGSERLSFDMAAQLRLARALGEDAPDASGADPQRLLGLLAGRFDGWPALRAFARERQLPHQASADRRR
mgnify:CR=1 FL=1